MVTGMRSGKVADLAAAAAAPRQVRVAVPVFLVKDLQAALATKTPIAVIHRVVVGAERLKQEKTPPCRPWQAETVAMVLRRRLRVRRWYTPVVAVGEVR